MRATDPIPLRSRDDHSDAMNRIPTLARDLLRSRFWKSPASSLPKVSGGGALAESIYTLIANGTLTFSLGDVLNCYLSLEVEQPTSNPADFSSYASADPSIRDWLVFLFLAEIRASEWRKGVIDLSMRFLSFQSSHFIPLLLQLTEENSSPFSRLSFANSLLLLRLAFDIRSFFLVSGLKRVLRTLEKRLSRTL